MPSRVFTEHLFYFKYYFDIKRKHKIHKSSLTALNRAELGEVYGQLPMPLFYAWDCANIFENFRSFLNKSIFP